MDKTDNIREQMDKNKQSNGNSEKTQRRMLTIKNNNRNEE